MRFAPGSQLDQFEIVEELGEGAYAETYKARDTATGGLVVLKIAEPEPVRRPAIFQRFQREAKIGRELDHPNVVSAASTTEKHRTEPYLVLEYVDGENLRQHARDAGRPGAGGDRDRLGPPARRRASPTCTPTASCTATSSPRTSSSLPTASCKITDFGTALLDGAKRLTWRHLTEGVGTPDYMSPEQIQGERGDARSDIYAWGVHHVRAAHRPACRSAATTGWRSWPATSRRDPKPLRESTARTSRPQLEAVVLQGHAPLPREPLPDRRGAARRPRPPRRARPGDVRLSPEPPMGGMAAVDSAKRLWGFVALGRGRLHRCRRPHHHPLDGAAMSRTRSRRHRVGAPELRRRVRHQQLASRSRPAATSTRPTRGIPFDGSALEGPARVPRVRHAAAARAVDAGRHGDGVARVVCTVLHARRGAAGRPTPARARVAPRGGRRARRAR